MVAEEECIPSLAQTGADGNVQDAIMDIVARPAWLAQPTLLDITVVSTTAARYSARGATTALEGAHLRKERRYGPTVEAIAFTDARAGAC